MMENYSVWLFFSIQVFIVSLSYFYMKLNG